MVRHLNSLHEVLNSNLIIPTVQTNKTKIKYKNLKGAGFNQATVKLVETASKVRKFSQKENNGTRKSKVFHWSLRKGSSTTINKKLEVQL